VEDPIVVVPVTTLSNVVDKIRVLRAKPFLLLGTLNHECAYILLLAPIIVHLEGLKNGGREIMTW